MSELSAGGGEARGDGHDGDGDAGEERDGREPRRDVHATGVSDGVLRPGTRSRILTRDASARVRIRGVAGEQTRILRVRGRHPAGRAGLAAPVDVPRGLVSAEDANPWPGPRKNDVRAIFCCRKSSPGSCARGGKENSDLSAGTLADRTSSRASPRESEPIARCKSPRAAHASP